MSKTNFITNPSGEGGGADLGDLLVRRDYFTEGSLWLAGYNSFGHLGDNLTTNKSSPVQTVSGGTSWKTIACGYGHTAGIKTDGTLWLWGWNPSGQLGDNTIVNKSSPVQTVSGGTTWKQVSLGYLHSAAIKTDGTLWLWGDVTYGQLGDNNSLNKSSPVQTVIGGNFWKMVSCGFYSTSAIKTDGTLWTWGYNVNGELGDNSSTDKSSPVQTVAGGSNWKLISSSSDGSLGIKTDGTLWCWGSGYAGQLGDNTNVRKSSPVQTISGGNNWKTAIRCSEHAAGIKTDGTLWVWGGDSYGQLGDNTTIRKSSPIQTISGGTSWKSISCGYGNIMAIKTDGTLWVWGRNNYGKLGLNIITNVSSPVQTIIGGTNWKMATGGNYHSAFLKDDMS